jgi:hypothetical protein
MAGWEAKAPKELAHAILEVTGIGPELYDATLGRKVDGVQDPVPTWDEQRFRYP